MTENKPQPTHNNASELQDMKTLTNMMFSLLSRDYVTEKESDAWDRHKEYFLTTQNNADNSEIGNFKCNAPAEIIPQTRTEFLEQLLKDTSSKNNANSELVKEIERECPISLLGNCHVPVYIMDKIKKALISVQNPPQNEHSSKACATGEHGELVKEIDEDIAFEREQLKECREDKMLNSYAAGYSTGYIEASQKIKAALSAPISSVASGSEDLLKEIESFSLWIYENHKISRSDIYIRACQLLDKCKTIISQPKPSQPTEALKLVLTSKGE